MSTRRIPFWIPANHFLPDPSLDKHLHLAFDDRAALLVYGIGSLQCSVPLSLIVDASAENVADVVLQECSLSFARPVRVPPRVSRHGADWDDHVFLATANHLIVSRHSPSLHPFTFLPIIIVRTIGTPVPCFFPRVGSDDAEEKLNNDMKGVDPGMVSHPVMDG